MLIQNPLQEKHGRLSDVLGFFIRLFNVDYGLYVRGQKFGKSKFGIKFLENAKFILTVSSELKISHIENINT